MGLVAGKVKCYPLKECRKPIIWNNKPPNQRSGRLRYAQKKCPNRDKKSYTCTAGSWFENVHFPTDQVIILMYTFARQMTYKMAIKE